MYLHWFFYEVHRQQMAELERAAAIRRQLPPRRRRLPRLGAAFHRLRREAQLPAVLATGPRSCP